jgi:hypothetical protein
MTEPLSTALAHAETVPSEPSGTTSPAPLAARYLVGILYYGGIDREHDRCVQSLKNHPYIHAVMEMHGCPYIDIGRGIIATKVLDDPQFGGLLFFDHDMIFEPDEVTKLIESTEACKGVVGAAYSMRRPGHMIGGIDTRKLGEGEKVVFFNGGGPRDATYLGMGMTAIHRSVFERLVKRADEKHEKNQEVLRKLLPTATPAEPAIPGTARPSAVHTSEGELFLHEHELPRLKSGISDADVVPFFSLLQLAGVYYGEDVSFCLRCHDAGIPVQIDTRVRVYHKGSYCYGLEDCGMVVPYCDRLESVNAPVNVVKNTPFHTPAVQDAIAAGAVLPEMSPPSAEQQAAFDEGVRTVESFPASQDPLSGEAAAQ